eukprot:TRINITY_DN24854_c0_g1_i1.p2 TRINITY_DN24854_c0_g1~~TRINITY_DN24854_c0_g1_i1.p2  ORF type:complete len:593 (+),score=156.74 TRINITY_DN24854_c0_g1_i1:94-1872(+)
MPLLRGKAPPGFDMGDQKATDQQPRGGPHGPPRKGSGESLMRSSSQLRSRTPMSPAGPASPPARALRTSSFTGQRRGSEDRSSSGRSPSHGNPVPVPRGGRSAGARCSPLAPPGTVSFWEEHAEKVVRRQKQKQRPAVRHNAAGSPRGQQRGAPASVPGMEVIPLVGQVKQLSDRLQEESRRLAAAEKTIREQEQRIRDLRAHGSAGQPALLVLEAAERAARRGLEWAQGEGFRALCFACAHSEPPSAAETGASSPRRRSVESRLREEIAQLRSTQGMQSLAAARTLAQHEAAATCAEAQAQVVELQTMVETRDVQITRLAEQVAMLEARLRGPASPRLRGEASPRLPAESADGVRAEPAARQLPEAELSRESSPSPVAGTGGVSPPRLSADGSPPRRGSGTGSPWRSAPQPEGRLSERERKAARDRGRQQLVSLGVGQEQPRRPSPGGQRKQESGTTPRARAAPTTGEPRDNASAGSRERSAPPAPPKQPPHRARTVLAAPSERRCTAVWRRSASPGGAAPCSASPAVFRREPVAAGSGSPNGSLRRSLSHQPSAAAAVGARVGRSRLSAGSGAGRLHLPPSHSPVGGKRM